MKRTRSVMLAAILLLSAMVVFASPVLAVTNDELDNYDPDYEDPIDTGEEMDDPAWNGTITNAETGAVMPGLQVEIYKKKWILPGWWKVGEDTTDSSGKYLIVRHKLMILRGQYAMRISDGSTREIYERYIGPWDSGDWIWGDPVKCMWNCPWDQTSEIPEFATIAIPAVALLGLFAFYRRKQKK